MGSHQEIPDAGFREQTAVRDLELRGPGGEFDVCSPEGANQDESVLMAGDADAATEPEESGLDDEGAGFFVHLPAHGLLPSHFVSDASGRPPGKPQWSPSRLIKTMPPSGV